MYTSLWPPILLIMILHGLWTSASTSNGSHRLQSIVDAAEDATGEDFMAQLSRILEYDEGFRLGDRHRRSIFSPDDGDDDVDEGETNFFDGSGDMIDDDLAPVFSNMSIIAITMGTTTTAFTKYTPHPSSSCQCDKGERGDKGDPGLCPADCAWTPSTETKECIGSRINLEKLAQSIRQLILDTKKIAYRNARATACACPVVTAAPTTTTISSVSRDFSPDYNMHVRLKGEKGDTGTSCSSTCLQSTQTHTRIFTTLREAMDASLTYPDHTYVHIVDERGRLQGVFIRVQGQLIPLRLESEKSLAARVQPQPPTSLSEPKTKCATTLPCPKLHLFALGPYIRKLCNSKRTDAVCSKLSDYDDLCKHVSEEHKLKGFYRAFMSSNNQWLANLFSEICTTAKIVNMNEEILFDSFESIFEQKPPQHALLDALGASPQFQYWWHGSLSNGTASRDTCMDWSRHDSGLSGIANRIPDGVHGLFHHPYTWPCSIGDSNMGILCIETNCDKQNYYKH